MLEPYQEAEARELAWDMKCERAPHCTCCGNSVLPGEIYFEYEDIVLCENCLDNATHDTSDLED